MDLLVAAFYRFTALPDFRDIQPQLLAVCEEAGILGTILLAEEGINGTICGTDDAIDAVFTWLQRDPRLSGLTYQPTRAPYPPFERLKVRLKAEIVALKTEADPTRRVGEYVEPTAWNALLSDPSVVVICLLYTSDAADDP